MIAGVACTAVRCDRRSFIDNLTPEELAVLARISETVLATLEEQP